MEDVITYKLMYIYDYSIFFPLIQLQMIYCTFKLIWSTSNQQVFSLQ